MKYLLPIAAVAVPLHLHGARHAVGGNKAELQAEEYFAQCAFSPMLYEFAGKPEAKATFEMEGSEWKLPMGEAEDCPAWNDVPEDVQQHVTILKANTKKIERKVKTWFGKPETKDIEHFFSHEETPVPTEGADFEVARLKQSSALPYNIAWPDKIIPYGFEVGCTWEDKLFVWSAMLILRARTNVGFVLVAHNAPGHKVLVQHATVGVGGSAAMGFARLVPGAHAANEIGYAGASTSQVFNAGMPAANRVFTAVHELLHAVGMGHMNQRTDALTCLDPANYGNYVYRGAIPFVNQPVNCDPGAGGWIPIPQNVPGSHFGYQSVMMYPPRDCCLVANPLVNCIVPVAAPRPALCTHHGDYAAVAYDRLYPADIEAVDLLYPGAHGAGFCRWWC